MAVREVVVNGIAHADYYGSGGVRVEFRSDSLTARNSRMFRIPVRLAESEGHSDPRNPNVMRMLMLTGLVERVGSGFCRVIEACRRMILGMLTITKATNPSTVKMSIKLTGERRIAPVEL